MSFHERNEHIIRRKVKAVKIWSTLMGLVNLLLGLLLVVFPVTFANMLDLVTADSDVRAALRGLGVLVAGMGLSYFLALGPHKGGRMVWFVTALLHGGMAVALVWLFEVDWLASNWLFVALYALLVAMLQMAVLRAGWWASVNKWCSYRGNPGRPENHFNLPF